MSDLIPKALEKKYLDPIIHEQDLYHYTAGCSVGVLVTKKVMKKLARLQSDHLLSVKKLLIDEADEDNVYPAMWTLCYPDGMGQTQVNYIDKSVLDVKVSINHCSIGHQPVRHEVVFVARTMDEAKEMANQHYLDKDNNNG